MTPWLRLALAFLVFCHGFVYIRIGSVLPGPVPRWRGTSWLFGDALTGSRLNAVVVGLHVVAGIATIVCAAAIGLAPAFPHWWRPLALGSGLVGLAAFAVFWDGQAELLFEEGALGAALSAALLMLALAFPAAFRQW